MRSMIQAMALAVAGTALVSGAAHAVPAVKSPAENQSAVQKTQGFELYIGPRYGYAPYRSYGYGYGYYPEYYYGPRRYYYAPRAYYYDSPRYRGNQRYFRRLQRKAP